MNISLQDKSTRAVLVLLGMLVVVSISPTPAAAIDRQRFGANQQRFPTGIRQPSVRNRTTQVPVHPHPTSRWILGVRVDNLQTGTGITHVFPASAAWRVGLEAKDTIVSINGYQIGFVNRHLYDLETELNLRADRNGWVRLLVWNHRNGELVNVNVALDRSRTPVPVPLPPRTGGINGTVTFRTALPAGQKAVVVVQLADITDRLKPVKVIRENRIPFSGQSPVAFHLSIDQSQLEAHRRYELKAHLSVNGRPLLATLPGAYRLSGANTRPVQLELKPIRFR